MGKPTRKASSRRRPKSTSGKLLRWTWANVARPGGSWFGRSVLVPGAKKSGKGVAWAWKTSVNPAERKAALERMGQRIDGKRRWVDPDIGDVQPRRKRPGKWTCFGCGQSAKGDGRDHVCPSTQRQVAEIRKASTAAKTAAQRKSKARRPVEPAANPTRGARIVRGNTSAERFAHVANANPETAYEFEQLLMDLSQGFLKLGQEINNVAEDCDLDPRVVNPLADLAAQVAELMEPVRTTRQAFRNVYRAHLEAAESNAKVPKSKPGFFAEVAS